MNTEKSREKGIIFTMLSAIIFGFTPILARIAYDGGSNGITMTFFRAFLALPVLYLLIRKKGISLRLSKRQMFDVAVTGTLGTGLTTVFLYMSYNYISVGLSTTLHFIYPLVVTLCCRLLFKERMGKLKWFALFLGAAGILFLLEPGSGISVAGIALSLLSGICYSFYILYLSKSELKDIPYFKLSFYLCIMMAATSMVFGTALGQLTADMTPGAWLCSFLVSMFTSVLALSLFQMGVKLSGPSSAAMLSTLEPITGVILGILVLKEGCSFFKIAGGICVVGSVLLVAKEGEKEKEI